MDAIKVEAAAQACLVHMARKGTLIQSFAEFLIVLKGTAGWTADELAEVRNRVVLAIGRSGDKGTD